MKKMQKVKKSVFKTMIETLIELLIAFKYAVIEELGKIAIVIQIIIPIICFYAGMDMKTFVFVIVLLTVIVKYIKEVGYKLNNVSERGFPLPGHRFTKMDNNGFIMVKDEDMQEAILYLCDVENYLRSKGLIKDDDTM